MRTADGCQHESRWPSAHTRTGIIVRAILRVDAVPLSRCLRAAFRFPSQAIRERLSPSQRGKNAQKERARDDHDHGYVDKCRQGCLIGVQPTVSGPTQIGMETKRWRWTTVTLRKPSMARRGRDVSCCLDDRTAIVAKETGCGDHKSRG